MFGFFKRWIERRRTTAKTFVKATGGGWRDAPDVLAADGGEHADYVGEVLRQASEHARQGGIEVGQEFEFKITNIPRGISSPHEIIFGLMMRAQEYGLMPGGIYNETAHFIRME